MLNVKRSSMRRAFLKILLPPVLAGLLTGCGTLDLVSKHQGSAPICEVHKTEMRPDVVQMTSWEIVYVQAAYSAPLNDLFPHHGGWVFQGERPYGGLGFPRKVRDFVCPDCTAAFRRYWKRGST